MDAILNSFLYIQLLHDTSVVLNNWPLGYLFNILFTVKEALNLYIIVSFFYENPQATGQRWVPTQIPVMHKMIPSQLTWNIRSIPCNAILVMIADYITNLFT